MQRIVAAAATKCSGERRREDANVLGSDKVLNHPLTATTTAVAIRFSAAAGKSTFQPNAIRRS